MDHLPRPLHSTVPTLLVPFLADMPYDFSGFGTFPYRKGFVHNGRLNGNHSVTALGSLLQSWLYFGLIAEVLGHPVNVADFTRTVNSGQPGSEVLCSTKLFVLLDAWQHRLREVGVERCDEKLRSVVKTIKVAIEGSELFDQIDEFQPTPDPVVVLSVKSLIITLIHLHNAINPEARFEIDCHTLIPLAADCYGRVAPAAKVLMARMSEAAWCLRAIRRVCMSHDYFTVMYLSQLKRQRTEGHEHCTTEVCLGYNVNQTEYITKHISADCHCQHAFVDVGKVISIIEDGGIPLVEIHDGESEEIQLVVIQATRKPMEIRINPPEARIYYAVSHVWADGLGNPHANSLPNCQLRYLLKRVSQVRRFWIDTLCIPVGDANAQTRRKAIDSMASIYHDATAVIVIDAEIQANCTWGLRVDRWGSPRRENGSHTRVECELHAYVLCSAWNSRCWTYQEAVLGEGALCIDTADGLALSFPREIILRRPWMSDEGMRWTQWRYRSHPLRIIRRYYGKMFTAMSMPDSFLIGFKVLCGPQAWERCRRPQAVGGESHENCDRIGLIGGTMWLTGAVFGGLLTIPGYTLWMLWVILVVGVAGPVCIAAIFASVPSSVLSTEETLGREFVEQLRADLAGQLLPTTIKKGYELKQPEAAGKMRARQFAGVWNAISWRSTTKVEDIHIILANLTDGAASEIDILPGAAQRMRAIAGNHTHLPIDLLFSSTALRDSENPWLPLVPSGDHITSVSALQTMRIGAEEIKITLSELAGHVVAFQCDEFENDAFLAKLQFLVLGMPIVPNANNADLPGRRNGRVVYMFELSGDNHHVGVTSMLRGARMIVREQTGEAMYCEYDAPVRLLSVDMAKIESANRSGARRLPMNTVLHIPFRNVAPDRSQYRRPIGFFMILMVFLLYTMDMITMLLAMGAHLNWSALYIGAPIWVTVSSVLLFVASRLFNSHDRSRFDKRLAGFDENARAQGVDRWLLYVAENFARGEGLTARWYHYTAESMDRFR